MIQRFLDFKKKLLAENTKYNNLFLRFEAYALKISIHYLCVIRIYNYIYVAHEKNVPKISKCGETGTQTQPRS